VHDDPAGFEAGALCELQLAQGRDVRAEPLLGEEPKQRQVRECLDAVDDERVGRSLPVLACRGTKGLLAVGDKRRSELLGQRRSPDAAYGELARLDRSAIGEEPEQLLAPEGAVVVVGDLDSAAVGIAEVETA
jgi:hypothetical protein